MYPRLVRRSVPQLPRSTARIPAENGETCAGGLGDCVQRDDAKEFAGLYGGGDRPDEDAVSTGDQIGGTG